MIRLMLLLVALFGVVGLIRGMQWDSAKSADQITWAGVTDQKMVMKNVQDYCPQSSRVIEDWNVLSPSSFVGKYGENCYRALSGWSSSINVWHREPSFHEKIFKSYDPNQRYGG